MVQHSFAEDQSVPQDGEQIRLSFAPIVQRTGPAVVNVYSERVVENRVVQFFEELFDQQFGDQFGGMSRERVQNSLGSGVIVSADGFIVTNHHVISGGTDIVVVLADRRSFKAELVLEDEQSDLAVLRVDSEGQELPWLELGDSDDLEVGDLVLAIGNPFGVGQTVTSGIVSALARTSVGVTDYQFFIQTDAAINPGNSGGALIDVSGRLIGVNTAIYSSSGGSHGIGFAIPSNMVRLVVNASRTGDRVFRPWLGASFQEVTQDIAELHGLDLPRGALVLTMHEMSPLRDAGLQRGDVVLSVDDHEVSSPEGVAYRFATSGIGGQASIAFIRDLETLTTEVDLITAPEVPLRDETLLSGRQPLSGAVVANLSPALIEELGLTTEEEGVIVLEVQSGPAARLGVRPGDVVLQIEGEDIASVDQLEDAVAKERQEWQLSIQRGDQIFNTRVRG
jgi:serine protease Do